MPQSKSMIPFYDMNLKGKSFSREKPKAISSFKDTRKFGYASNI